MMIVLSETLQMKKNKFIEKYDIDMSKFYVQYAGNIGYTFDYKMVLDIAEKINNNKNIIFQLVGDGAFKEDFIREAKQRNLSNTRIGVF